MVHLLVTAILAAHAAPPPSHAPTQPARPVAVTTVADLEKNDIGLPQYVKVMVPYWVVDRVYAWGDSKSYRDFKWGDSRAYNTGKSRVGTYSSKAEIPGSYSGSDYNVTDESVAIHRGASLPQSQVDIVKAQQKELAGQKPAGVTSVQIVVIPGDDTKAGGETTLQMLRGGQLLINLYLDAKGTAKVATAAEIKKFTSR